MASGCQEQPGAEGVCGCANPSMALAALPYDGKGGTPITQGLAGSWGNVAFAVHHCAAGLPSEDAGIPVQNYTIAKWRALASFRIPHLQVGHRQSVQERSLL